MREYDIERTETKPPHGAPVEGTPWERAARLEIDRFNWYESGPRPKTTARLLYDADALHLHFRVEDRTISSRVTELNGPTFEDSSVELFADPDPDPDSDDDSHYFNFEVNCCGYFKLAWQPSDWRERDVGRDLLPAALADRIDVTTSVAGPTRDPRDDDEGWWLVATVPFAVLAEFTGVDVDPDEGTVWRANAYRSGVATESQMASWNPIPTSEPAYHTPDHFGRLQFR